MVLISVDELGRRLPADDDGIRVADVRWYLNRPGAGRAAYDAGHIPGTIFLDLDDDLSDPNGLGAPGRHPLPSPAAFRRRLEAAGIGSRHFVVAYDDSGGTTAARLWWMLDNLRHRGGVAVLDGGIGAWISAGRTLDTSDRRYAPESLDLKDEWTNVVARSELAGRLGDLTLLDARAPERYRGEVEPIDPVAGHIATAVNAPTAANLGADGRFLAPAELHRRYSEQLDERPVVTYCGSGTTACHNSLAMRIAGLPDPILYVGSYSDWSRSGMPVVTGDEPVPVLDRDAQRRER
jgi:thiosulfate/3-mercaptopyruvate sulfurtransferase